MHLQYWQNLAKKKFGKAFFAWSSEFYSISFIRNIGWNYFTFHNFCTKKQSSLNITSLNWMSDCQWPIWLALSILFLKTIQLDEKFIQFIDFGENFTTHGIRDMEVYFSYSLPLLLIKLWRNFCLQICATKSILWVNYRT